MLTVWLNLKGDAHIYRIAVHQWRLYSYICEEDAYDFAENRQA